MLYLRVCMFCGPSRMWLPRYGKEDSVGEGLKALTACADAEGAGVSLP